MGFIKAFTGALGGTFADQWKDFYMPEEGVPATAGVFRAVPKGTNNGRGSNTKGTYYYARWSYYRFHFRTRRI